MSISRKKSSSSPSSAEDLTTYWNKMNEITGGDLGTWAKDGTAPVNYDGIGEDQVRTADYEGLTADQVRAVGGMGATRKNEAEQARRRALEEAAADPNLSVAQRARVSQLTDQDYSARADAIAKETEAALTGLLSQETGRAYEADRANADQVNAVMSEERKRVYDALLNNAQLSLKDKELLGQLFYGGKGTNSKESGWSASYWG